MNEIYLLTGGNMGDRQRNLKRASEMIERTAGPILKTSSIYETAAWGYEDQPAFLNQILCIQSALTAKELLHQLLSIELELGRKRIEKMGRRVIDIDILFYDQEIITTAELIVPHPRIAERRFVLMPLSEIAPDFVHPVLHETIAELLAVCKDPLEVKIYEPSK